VKLCSQLFSSEEKIPQVAGHGQNRSKIDFLKEGVDGFSYFHLFSVILFPNQNLSCLWHPNDCL
jgi:hypothetical protein